MGRILDVETELVVDVTFELRGSPMRAGIEGAQAREGPRPGGDHMYIPIGIGTLIVIIVLIALLT